MQLVMLANRTRKLALLTFLAACQAAPADPPKPELPKPELPKPELPKPEPPPAKQFERDMTLRFHMHQSYDLVRAIERLLIRGKLDEAKHFAEAIAMAPEDPSLGPWATLTAAVRDRAMALARATSVDDALHKETQLAAACADCHREHHGSARFEQPPAAPPDQPTVDARMTRHRWAADRLWEAVVGDADDAWQGGLDVLAAAPLELDAERAPYARELQRLANAALRTKPPIVNRARTYGEILVTCAGCHAKTK